MYFKANIDTISYSISPNLSPTLLYFNRLSSDNWLVIEITDNPTKS